MQFNSVKRGNFGNLARSVNREADRIFNASRETSVNHTDIANASIKGRSLERRAAMKAEATVAKAGLEAVTNTKLTKTKIDTAKDVANIKRPAKRMAGIVGGLGAIAGGYVMMEGNKKDKADRAELSGMRDALNAKQNRFAEESEARREKWLNDYMNGGSTKDAGVSNTGTVKSTVATNSVSPTSTPKAKSDKSNWGALSSIIRTVEGTTGDEGYTTRFGGHQFQDLSRHPNIAAPTPWGTKSEAAGAYQFMKPTWDEAKSALGLTDFSRESQEKAGRFLTQRRGVNPDTRFNNFEDFSAAISKLSPEWAGLPNSQSGRTGYHGQANADMQQLWTQYQNYFN
jgi:lysozyme